IASRCGPPRWRRDGDEANDRRQPARRRLRRARAQARRRADVRNLRIPRCARRSLAPVCAGLVAVELLPRQHRGGIHGTPDALSARCACNGTALLDGQLATRSRGLLHEFELENAVLELRLTRGVVELDRQREAAVDAAVIALAAQYARILRRKLGALHFGGDRHLVAFDRDVDLVLLHTRKLGTHEIAAIRFGYVDANAVRTCAIAALRTEEAAKQRIDRGLGEWVVQLKAGHVRHSPQ